MSDFTNHHHCLSTETVGGVPCQNAIAPGQEHCYLHGGASVSHLPQRYATNGLDAPLLDDTHAPAEGTLDEEGLIYGEDAMDGLAAGAPRLLSSRDASAAVAPEEPWGAEVAADVRRKNKNIEPAMPERQDYEAAADARRVKRSLFGKVKGANLFWSTMALREAAGTELLDDGTIESGNGLHKADLRRADLSATHLHDLLLLEVNLSEADLTSARGNKNTFIEHADLSKATLDYADFTQTSFIGSDLKAVSLRCVNMRSARCKDVDFREAVIEGSDFTGADLTNADFRGAVITNTIFGDAILTGAKFDGDVLPADSATPWTNKLPS